MAKVNPETIKLPEEVAKIYEYTGNGATRYTKKGLGTVDVTKITLAQAARCLELGVHFLKKKDKAPAPAVEDKPKK